MPARWPWIERTFRFDFPVGKFPDILCRYRGAPARVEELTRGLSEAVLVGRDAPERWSIKENIGHLIDLEPLWERRVDDYLRGAERLAAADMTNAATRMAGHNDRDLAELTGAFRRAREALAARLGALGEDDWARESVHPRLNQRMRLVDAIAFTCDHDDYHLARIVELAAFRTG